MLFFLGVSSLYSLGIKSDFDYMEFPTATATNYKTLTLNHESMGFDQYLTLW